MKFKKIFFSYSRTDTEFAVQLASDLKKEGYDVWIDQEDIRAGSEWDRQIEEALTTSDCLVFIQSERSAASPNVLDEVYFALEENKTVIPVIIGESKAPFRIKRLQHINFIGNYEAGLTSLKDNLKGAALPEISTATIAKKTSFLKIFKSTYLIGLLLVVIAVIAFYYFKSAEAISTQTNDIAVIPLTDFTGNWRLNHMQPPLSREIKGYLKIEDAGEGKLNIKTAVQFYYPKANDTAYLNVFNTFAECAGCVFKNEIPITDKQVDIGAQRYVISKKGDTTLNAGANKAVLASVTLYLISKDSVFMTIGRPDAVEASYGITIPPFSYSFFFKKDL